MAADDVLVGVGVQDEGGARVVRALLVELRKLRSETQSANRTTGNLTSGVRGLIGAAAGIGAAFAGLRAFTEFTRIGLRFNEAIETSTLGIASLVSAQAELRNEQGTLLKGTAALGAAQEIAADQVAKLRIAGIQTAATTEQLTEAFQVAIGAGLGAGLAIDDIRQITIRATQAAGALGVPFNQLNQEVRALLSGDIDKNARIGTALGITRADIEAAKERNQLTEFLLGRLQAFGTAGDAITGTFAAFKSNVQEALAVFAGDATKPLFNALKRDGQAALSGIFDLDTAQISESFSGLLTTMQDIFGGLGDLLGDMLGTAVENAEALSGWLDENRTQVNEIFGVVGLIVDQFGALVSDVTGIFTGLVDANAEANSLVLPFKAVAYAVAGFRDGLTVIIALLGSIGGRIAQVMLRPFMELLRVTGRVGKALGLDFADNFTVAADTIQGLLDDAKAFGDTTLTQFANGDTAMAALEERLKTVAFLAARAKRDVAETVAPKTGPLATVTTKDTDTAKELKEAAKQAKEREDIEIALLEATGQKVLAKQKELEQKFREVRKRMVAEGDTSGIAMMDKLINIELAKVKAEDLEDIIKKSQDILSARVDEIEAKRSAGLISQTEQAKLLEEAYAAAMQQITEALPALKALATATGDPAIAEQVRKLEEELTRISLSSAQVKTALEDMGDTAKETAEGELSDFFSAILSGNLEAVKSFGDMARAVVGALSQVIAQMLATLAIQTMLKAFGFAAGGPVSTGSPVPMGKAAGGYISGPGTKTSDSIPARLSDGEYVIRAAAVDKYGVDLFEALNGMNLPGTRGRSRGLRGYADGGLVQPAGAPGGGTSSLSVGLEDGLVLREIESSAGQRVFVRTMQKNAKSIKAALGL